MKIITISIILCQISFLSLSQSQSEGGSLFMPMNTIFYNGYDNDIEFSANCNCDSFFLESESGEFTLKGENELRKTKYGTFRTDKKSRNSTISVICIKGTDSTIVYKREFSNFPLPDPIIQYGFINLQTINSHDTVIFERNRHIFKFENRNVYHVNIKLNYWQITLNEVMYKFSGNQFIEAHALFSNAKPGDKLSIDLISLEFPDDEIREYNLYKTLMCVDSVYVEPYLANWGDSLFIDKNGNPENLIEGYYINRFVGF